MFLKNITLIIKIIKKRKILIKLLFKNILTIKLYTTNISKTIMLFEILKNKHLKFLDHFV